MLEAEVIRIISWKPKLEFDKYIIKVEYVCYGLCSETYLAFDNEQDALNLKIGHKFKIYNWFRELKLFK